MVYHYSGDKAKLVYKEVSKGEGESDEASVNGDRSRMDKEDDNDTSENGEQAIEHSVRTKVVTRPHENNLFPTNN